MKPVFIKLHKEGAYEGNVYIVNVANVIEISHDSGGYTFIGKVNGTMQAVKESPDEIMELIKKACS